MSLLTDVIVSVAFLFAAYVCLDAIRWILRREDEEEDW